MLQPYLKVKYIHIESAQICFRGNNTNINLFSQLAIVLSHPGLLFLFSPMILPSPNLFTHRLCELV